ncbi:MAG: MFS transporter [Bdellovibrionaceae bacterium]|nr:MFS transporter [Pseudobdellovibrionaceae bacterium]
MSTPITGHHASAPTKVVRERALLFVLAGAQFVHILDFVILMPMGPQFMRELGISPQQFGFLVSVYTFSAALWSIAGTLFMDRFDRKSTLLTLYLGFTLGTLACGLAPGFEFLLFGRAVAGAFGGLMGAVVFSIIGDTFHESRRGAATGTVMSAFAIASVIGVPIGLWASHLSWRLPFVGLSALSVLMMLVALQVLPSMKTHLGSRNVSSVVEDLRFMVVNRDLWSAYGMIVALMFAAFSVIPFLATYLVRNVGLAERELPYIYLCGGAVTFATSRLIGRLADRYGKHRMFVILSAISMLPIFFVTHLPRVPLAVAILVTTFFTLLISSRAIPVMSLITSSVESRRRGRFMSLTSAVQQMASGLASLVAGMILTEAASGELMHYKWVGYLSIAATLVSIALGRRLKIVGG